MSRLSKAIRQIFKLPKQNKSLPPGSSTPVMNTFESLNFGDDGHAAGAFPTGVLKIVEAYLPREMSRTAETGCGKSTVLFSNLSNEHHVFAYDDRAQQKSSVLFYESCPQTRADCIITHFGPTQKTVPAFEHQTYDAVLIDGPHGWPFPELEYYFFYPHIRSGGFLIIDDVNIPTIGRMADILAEDAMWSLAGMAGVATAIFKRTDAPAFDPYGDGWWSQPYNRRRVSSKNRHFIPSNADIRDKFSSLKLDKKIRGK